LTGSTICTACPAGKVSTDGLTCSAATTTTVQPIQTKAATTTTVQPIQTNAATTTTVQPIQTNLIALNVITNVVALNVICAPGQFLNDTSCASCQAGSYTATINTAKSCNPCPAGSFSSSGASSCTNCVAGTYSTAGASGCISCFPGSYSNNGASGCTACGPNSYSGSGASSCVKCPSDQVANSLFTGCVTPTTTLTTTTCLSTATPTVIQGSWACACALGYEYINNGCTQCKAGTYSPNGNVCKQVPNIGYSKAGAFMFTVCESAYVPNDNHDNPVNCPIGYYSFDNVFVCTQCPPGGYHRDGRICNACPPNTYNPNFGATALSACINCPAGYSSKQGSPSCSYNCGAGFGNTNCNSCSSGTFSAGGLNATCTQCPAGTFSSAQSSTCTPCSAGTYSTGGASSCTPCPSGQTSLTGSSTCYTICNAGQQYQGSTECQNCPAGTYSINGSCLSCSTGFYSKVGSDSCTSCPPGTTNVSGNSGCQSCPTGYYSPGGSLCLKCPVGFISSSNLATCVFPYQNNPFLNQSYSGVSMSSSFSTKGNSMISLQSTTFSLIQQNIGSSTPIDLGSLVPGKGKFSNPDGNTFTAINSLSISSIFGLSGSNQFSYANDTSFSTAQFAAPKRGGYTAAGRGGKGYSEISPANLLGAIAARVGSFQDPVSKEFTIQDGTYSASISTLSLRRGSYQDAQDALASQLMSYSDPLSYAGIIPAASLANRGFRSIAQGGYSLYGRGYRSIAQGGYALHKNLALRKPLAIPYGFLLPVDLPLSNPLYLEERYALEVPLSVPKGGLTISSGYTLSVALTLIDGSVYPAGYTFTSAFTLNEGETMAKGFIVPPKGLILPANYVLPAGSSAPKGFILDSGYALTKRISFPNSFLLPSDFIVPRWSIVKGKGFYFPALYTLPRNLDIPSSGYQLKKGLTSIVPLIVPTAYTIGKGTSLQAALYSPSSFVLPRNYVNAVPFSLPGRRLMSPGSVLDNDTYIPAGYLLPPGFVLPSDLILPVNYTLPAGFTLNTDLIYPPGFTLPSGTTLPVDLNFPSEYQFVDDFQLPSTLSLKSGFILPSDLLIADGFVLPVKGFTAPSKGLFLASGYVLGCSLTISSDIALPVGYTLSVALNLSPAGYQNQGYVVQSTQTISSGTNLPAGFVIPSSGYTIPSGTPLPVGFVVPDSGLLLPNQTVLPCDYTLTSAFDYSPFIPFSTILPSGYYAYALAYNPNLFYTLLSPPNVPFGAFSSPWSSNNLNPGFSVTTNLSSVFSISSSGIISSTVDVASNSVSARPSNGIYLKNTEFGISNFKVNANPANSQIYYRFIFSTGLPKNHLIKGIVRDSQGNTYFSAASSVVKIYPNGTTITFAGSSNTICTQSAKQLVTSGKATSISFCDKDTVSLAMDFFDNLYVADNYNGIIYQIDPNQNINRVIWATAYGMAADSKLNLYYSDGASSIYYLNSTNAAVRYGTGVSGFNDGVASVAQFNMPNQVTLDFYQNLYVADAINCLIRKINTTGYVLTVAGTLKTPGYKDGPALSALFVEPAGIAVDIFGNIFIADKGNALIRFYNASNGMVSTIAGQQRDQGLLIVPIPTTEPTPAISATLGNLVGYLFLDDNGNLYGGADDISGKLNIFVMNTSVGLQMASTVYTGVNFISPAYFSQQASYKNSMSNAILGLSSMNGFINFFNPQYTYGPADVGLLFGQLGPISQLGGANGLGAIYGFNSTTGLNNLGPITWNLLGASHGIGLLHLISRFYAIQQMIADWKTEAKLCPAANYAADPTVIGWGTTSYNGSTDTFSINAISYVDFADLYIALVNWRAYIINQNMNDSQICDNWNNLTNYGGAVINYYLNGTLAYLPQPPANNTGPDTLSPAYMLQNLPFVTSPISSATGSIMKPYGTPIYAILYGSFSYTRRALLLRFFTDISDINFAQNYWAPIQNNYLGVIGTPLNTPFVTPSSLFVVPPLSNCSDVPMFTLFPVPYKCLPFGAYFFFPSQVADVGTVIVDYVLNYLQPAPQVLPNDPSGIYVVVFDDWIGYTMIGNPSSTNPYGSQNVSYALEACGYHTYGNLTTFGSGVTGSNNYTVIAVTTSVWAPSCLPGTVYSSKTPITDFNTASTVNWIAPNNDVGFDGMINTVMHELVETLTNPSSNGFVVSYQDYSMEIGDYCDFNITVNPTYGNGTTVRFTSTKYSSIDSYTVQNVLINGPNGWQCSAL